MTERFHKNDATLRLQEGEAVPQTGSSMHHSGRLTVQVVQNRPKYFREQLAKVVTSNNKSLIKNVLGSSLLESLQGQRMIKVEKELSQNIRPQ